MTHPVLDRAYIEAFPLGDSYDANPLSAEAIWATLMSMSIV